MIAEIAISLVLLAGAGLTIRSFLQLRDAHLGFRTDHIVTARVTIPTDKYVKDQQVASFYDRALERVRTTPGVESVGLVSYLPLTGHNFDNSSTSSASLRMPQTIVAIPWFVSSIRNISVS